MSRKILIVEDNDIIAQQLSFFLQRHNFITATCSTGEEALKLVMDFCPDLILMDIRLAGEIDGIEATSKIKKIYNCPIIFLTSHTENSIVERALLVEPDGFISKNISHSELKVQIDYQIKKYQKIKEQLDKVKSLEDNIKIYELIFNNAKDAIFYLNENFEVNYFNQASENLFSFKAENIIGNKLFDLIVDERDKSSFFEELVQIKKIDEDKLFYKKFLLNLCKTDGEVFPAELYLGKVIDRGKISYCCFIRDISEQINAEEQVKKLIEEMQFNKEIIEQNASELVQLNAKLVESEEQLKELNTSKDKFFSIIAHDLKGPFQNLIGYSQLLVQEFDSLSSDEIREVSIDLYNSAKNLYRLLENLLQWSRLQRGVIEFNPVEFEISLLVSQNFDLLHNVAKDKNISLISNVPDNLIVYADLNMINTVIRNLLTNAIKFTNCGGKIELNATLSDDNFVKIEVKDNGIGMSENFVKNVFKIDAVKSTPGTNNEQGTGLGLILCKDFVEKNNGKITVESKLGEGTTFTILLPASNSQ
ncbi:MAG TPA: response regulator [Candidatus Kapabacteria bacterium]|jgi:PAS domain S-box-containing protein|nr:response regulator [Candidatus Kapabacteria bacterium]